MENQQKISYHKLLIFHKWLSVDFVAQIRFSYSDKSVLALGHDTGGKADLNPMILAKGEYLVAIIITKLRGACRSEYDY